MGEVHLERDDRGNETGTVPLQIVRSDITCVHLITAFHYY